MTTLVDGNEFDISGAKLVAVKSVLGTATNKEEERFIMAPSILQGSALITDDEKNDVTHWLVAGDAVRVTRMKRGDKTQVVENATQGAIGANEVLYICGEGQAQLSVSRT